MQESYQIELMREKKLDERKHNYKTKLKQKHVDKILTLNVKDHYRLTFPHYEKIESL